MKLLVRADADTRIGTGHVMRCLALGQAWVRAGGSVTFSSRLEADWLRTRLESAGFAVVAADPSDGGTADADRTRQLAEEIGARAVVADGYHFGEPFQSRLRGLRLLVVDDEIHSSRYTADLILNQNLHAETLEYPRAPETRCLLGPRYSLLREEFLRFEASREFPQTARRVLVTLGGSDEANVTATVMRALARLDSLSCRVLAGAANPHAEELSAIAAQHPGRFEVLKASDQMPQEMAEADLAISAGGSTCWELAFMGLPAVVITLAPNQEHIGPSLAARGVCVDVGWHTSLTEPALAATISGLARDAQRRRTMSDQGRMLVDGRGAERVVEALRS